MCAVKQDMVTEPVSIFYDHSSCGVIMSLREVSQCSMPVSSAKSPRALQKKLHDFSPFMSSKASDGIKICLLARVRHIFHSGKVCEPYLFLLHGEPYWFM